MALMMKSSRAQRASARSAQDMVAVPRVAAAPVRRHASAMGQQPKAPRASGARSPATVMAMATAPSTSQPAGAPQQQKQWYALVANAEFFFNDPQNEAMAEQLRERVRYFNEQNQERDFHFVPNPAWLDARFPDKAKQVKRPFAALVSTDKTWITFMKLRLDRVLMFDLSAVPQAEVLQAGEPVPRYPPPAKWTAPYAPYAAGWWEVFYPKA